MGAAWMRSTNLLAPAAIRARLLAVPGATVTMKYLNDLSVDGVCRVTAGQVPNLDFHAADDALNQEAAFGGDVRPGLAHCVRARPDTPMRIFDR
jgi:hypothetical protein